MVFWLLAVASDLVIVDGLDVLGLVPHPVANA
jgi:hypothetical protein